MIHNQIVFFRKSLKYTQLQMAQLLNISQPCYNRYEKGIREPDLETLKKLCIIFDCTADELLEIDTPQDRKKVVINYSTSSR